MSSYNGGSAWRLQWRSCIFILATFGNVLRHKGVTRQTEETGRNRESLYNAFSGKPPPTWDTVHRLLHTLGVQVTLAA